MRRRVYGEEIAAEPSQFLNELPIELIEDLSAGPSWLSYARSSGTQSSKAAAGALRGETYAPPKKKNLYTGQTYNSADAIAEFFKNRKAKKDDDATGNGQPMNKPSRCPAAIIGI